MTNKHTPGPWGFANAGQNMRNKYSQHYAVYCAESGSSCILISGCFGDIPGEEDTAAANARLIAAAPDLLAAVVDGAQLRLPELLEWVAERLVHIHGEHPNVDYVQTLRDRAEKVRAAITKAEGQP